VTIGNLLHLQVK